MASGFKAFDPNAEVIGRSMLSNFQNLNKDHFVPILKQHGIEEIDPQGWYSQQKWLDILKEVSETSGDGMFDFVAVGLSIAKLAPFPPQITTIDIAFDAMAKVYQGNHRNGYVGEWVTEVSEPNKIVERVNAPYPDDFVYGVTYGIAKRFLPPGTAFTVSREIKENACIFTITW
ncbi:MAG: hypothetical protein ABI947_09830 [Chloroflexota bacterium]